MKRDREISQFVVTPCETSLQLLVALPPFRYLKKLETGQKQDEPPPKKSNQWTLSEQHASSPKSGLSFSLPPLEMHVSFTMLIHAQWLRADSVTAAVSLNISLLSKSFSSSFSFLVLSIYADHFHLSVSLDSSLSIFSLGGSYNPALIGGGGGS